MKINLFLINQVDKKPWLKLSIPVLPRKGEVFEMEKGKTYLVDHVWYKPSKSGTCSINVCFTDPGEAQVQES